MAVSEPEYKMVRITSKRQFTIPKIYFDKLRLGEAVKCYLEGERLILEPVREDSFWDFSTDILRSLVAEGYQGETLLDEFEARKRNALQALGSMVEGAYGEAQKGEGRPADVVFGELLGEDDVLPGPGGHVRALVSDQGRAVGQVPALCISLRGLLRYRNYSRP